MLLKAVGVGVEWDHLHDGLSYLALSEQRSLMRSYRFPSLTIVHFTPHLCLEKGSLKSRLSRYMRAI
jgi:hypothetical protein